MLETLLMPPTHTHTHAHFNCETQIFSIWVTSGIFFHHLEAFPFCCCRICLLWNLQEKNKLIPASPYKPQSLGGAGRGSSGFLLSHQALPANITWQKHWKVCRRLTKSSFILWGPTNAGMRSPARPSHSLCVFSSVCASAVLLWCGTPCACGVRSGLALLQNLSCCFLDMLCWIQKELWEYHPCGGLMEVKAELTPKGFFFFTLKEKVLGRKRKKSLIHCGAQMSEMWGDLPSCRYFSGWVAVIVSRTSRSLDPWFIAGTVSFLPTSLCLLLMEMKWSQRFEPILMEPQIVHNSKK